MKKFEFRLQRILDLARRREEAARRAAAAALAALRSAEDEDRRCRERVSATLEDIAAQLRGESIEPGSLQLLQAFLAREQEQAAVAAAAAAQAELRHGDAHAEMAEKRRELMALERAREDAWEAWRVESKKSELDEIEDVTAGRSARKIRGE